MIRDGKKGQQTGLGNRGRVRVDVSLETELVRLPEETLLGRAGRRGAVLMTKA